jgi:hypothetical protein
VEDASNVVEVVIGDVHARGDALRALLETVGAIDRQGRRCDGFWIVQLGDLLDRRAEPDENLATARLAVAHLDTVLAGNHEARMLRQPGCEHGAALSTLAARGWPHAAAACGNDWLITHAGVHPALARGLSRRAIDCAEQINDRWHRRADGERDDPLFDWIGPARGGDAPYGGIFWMHPGEWRTGADAPWGQIVGHVPQPAPRMLGGRRWAIDLGGRDGRLAALVRSSDDDGWQPVVVRAPRRRASACPPGRKRAAAAR